MTHSATSTYECPLTRVELTVIQLSADGLPAKQLAYEMAITQNVVHHHLNSARNKLGSVNMASLVATALRRGWIS